MTSGLFDPSFRGAGSPGAPGVGSTLRGLQLVEQGKLGLEQGRLGLEQARAAQPGALEGIGFQDQSRRDQARLSSIVQGAIQLKQIRDPREKLAFIQQRKVELKQAGLSTTDTDVSPNASSNTVGIVAPIAPPTGPAI